MKTKLVRPVLVEKSGDTHILTKNDGIAYTRTVTKQQLILISLDPDEKIEEKDTVYIDLDINSRTTKIVDMNHDHDEYTIEITEGYARLDMLTKVIAIQDQLSPYLINQLVDEYNNGGMQDFEIEMHNNLNDPERLCDFEEPYMPNGFVTVVDNLNKLPSILQHILDKMAENNNRIDLNVYAKGILDGYEARKSEELISYSEEEIKALINKAIFDTVGNPMLITSELKINDSWFNENKKK